MVVLKITLKQFKKNLFEPHDIAERTVKSNNRWLLYRKILVVFADVGLIN